MWTNSSSSLSRSSASNDAPQLVPLEGFQSFHMAAKARNFTVTGSESVAENFYERLVQAADSGEHTDRIEAVNIVPRNTPGAALSPTSRQPCVSSCPISPDVGDCGSSHREEWD